MGDNMAAKKTTPRPVRVRARVSFHDIRQGDEATLVVDSIVQGWLDAGLMEVIDGGEDQPAGETVDSNAAGASGNRGEDFGDGQGAGADRSGLLGTSA